jgi:hypothetical protein
VPECIHGLEFGLCDICSPPAAAPASSRTSVARAPRRETSSLRTPRSSAPRTSAPARSATGSLIDESRTRVFHVTHVDNLIGIAEEGALVAGAEPLVDISSSGARGARAVATADGVAVSEFVPFFVSADSSVWESIRAGEPDPRLAVPAGSVASDFVILAAPLANLGDYVVADGDAAHPLTRFGAGREARLRMLRSVAIDQTGRGRDAEVLVRDRLPLAEIAVFTVGNDRAKRAATEALQSAGVRARVAIHPPWFALDRD